MKPRTLAAERSSITGAGVTSARRTAGPESGPKGDLMCQRRPSHDRGVLLIGQMAMIPQQFDDGAMVETRHMPQAVSTIDALDTDKVAAIPDTVSNARELASTV